MTYLLALIALQVRLAILKIVQVDLVHQDDTITCNIELFKLFLVGQCVLEDRTLETKWVNSKCT